MFPKRYFLFFDIFVRAGRHNRDLWKKAIRENKGLNDKRFGPPIFEAHVRTTVRENYFKWIFQQMTDIHEVEDEDVADFQMEYDANVYTELPRILACSHKELTRFPFKNCEINYGKLMTPTGERDDDNDSYSSAKGFLEPITTSPSPANEGAGNTPSDGEDGFLLVYKNVNARLFNNIREQQRKDMKNVIEKAKGQHREVLECLKTSIQKIREVKRTLPDTDPMYKAAIAEAKKIYDCSKTRTRSMVMDQCRKNAGSQLKIKPDFRTQR